MRCLTSAEPAPKLAPASRISASASPNHSGRKPDVDEPGAGDLRSLDCIRDRPLVPARFSATSRGGLPAAGARAERDIRRVVAVLVLRGPLQLDLRVLRGRSARLRAGAGTQPATVSRGAKWPARALSSASVPTAIIDVAHLERDIRARRRVERPVPPPEGDHKGPVSRRSLSSRIVLPAHPDVGVSSNSSSLDPRPSSVVTLSRNAATCGRSTSFAIVLPAVANGCVTRSAPARSSLR